MTSKIDKRLLEEKIRANADAYAEDHLPDDSFARYAYRNKPYPALRSAGTLQDVDRSECRQWGLTPREWAEEMDAARLALAHDLKLDLIKKGSAGAL